ncbi:MAG TPA: UDP-N-acetylmuramoyl-L-alanyl-D-glutamate--2,6-diaminopimelate ligase [Terriglobales bacterium]|nr:UDP-N-acetylmuramoyl-L-alanyl-D-glutamate--2,6-diaminopimelate ligase [Terriglobales bacterium]
MTFRQLLDGVETLAQRGNPEITGLQYDSRRISPGDLFVAMRGETTDGNRFIEDAIACGAVAVVSDTTESAPHPGIAWAHVPHGRQALAGLAANFYGRPAVRMKLTGITGTNGKTTTAFLAEAMLGAMGRTAALIGTVEYHVGPEVLPAPHTTPEPLEIHALLDRASRHGASEMVMEVSSHALAQQRVYGLPFDVAVFTNLTRDHLDYHRDFDDYFEAKKSLFAGCGAEPPRAAILNADDDYGVRLVPFAKSQGSQVVTYGIERGDIRAMRIELRPQGTAFVLSTPRGDVAVTSSLIGRVNVYNILAAAAAAIARGCSLEAVRRGAAAVRRVPGRFESVDCGQPFAVVVDYAHTDDALRNLTSLARSFVTREGRTGRVITLFGCGGDRDRTKRPLMGEAAGRGSDFVILTSDNPRSEDPLAIINDALVGLQKTGTRHVVEPDRRRAIARALAEARPGDIVLIAGKGHERVQVSAAGSLPFDDVEVAREALHAAGFAPQGMEATAAGGRP